MGSRDVGAAAQIGARAALESEQPEEQRVHGEAPRKLIGKPNLAGPVLLILMKARHDFWRRRLLDLR